MQKVLVLAIGMFALGLDAYVLAGLLPSIAADFHISTAAAGQIVTAFTLSYALLSPVLAVATARLDRRVVMIVALLIFALANAGSIAAPSFLVLMMSRVLAGAAAGLYSPSAAAAATQLVPSRQRGRALASIVGGLTAAIVFGVPLGLLVSARFGWRAVLTMVIALSLFAIVGVAARLPSIRTATPGLRERLAVLSDPAVLGRVMVMLLAAIASLGLYTYLAPLLTTLGSATPATMPSFFLLWGVAAMVGNACTGWLLDRGVAASTILTVSLLALSVSLFGFPAIGHSSVGAALLIAIWGGSVWSLQVPIQHQLAISVPEHAATAIALLASSVYLGSAIGSGLQALVLSVSVAALGPVAGAVSLMAFVVHRRSTVRDVKHPGRIELTKRS